MIGHVGIMRRANADGSITYYIRWFSQEEEGQRKNQRIRVGRTAPKPTQAECRQWDHKARLAAAEKEQEIMEGKTRRPSMHPSEAVGEYLEWSENLVAPATLRQRESDLSRFSAWLIQHGVTTIFTLTRPHLATWRADLAERLRPSSILTACTVVQGFLDFLIERDWIQQEHLRAVGKQERRKLELKAQAQSRERVFVDTSRLRDLVIAAEPLTGATITTIAGTGLRIGEYQAVEIGWWDADAKVLDLQMPSSGTKRHCRRVPVGEYVAARINDFAVFAQPPGPLFRTAAGVGLKARLCRYLSPRGLTPHDLRRWYSNTLLYMEPPCPDAVRKALLGHTLSKRDLAYCHPGDTERQRPWAERISEALEG